MRRIITLAGLVLATLFSGAAAAQVPVQCSGQQYKPQDAAAIRRQIRLLRNAGYRVDVTKRGKTERVDNGLYYARQETLVRPCGLPR